MARFLSILALILAYVTTLFFIAAMVTPWWYTRYHPVGQSEDQFYGSNPSLDPHTGLFDRTNCFIDGSCITGGQIYKNNSTLQWVYTAILVLMIIAWFPWLLFVHLIHFRSNKNRTQSRAYRPLMVISALLTWLLILAAVLVFGIGMYKTNGVYNAGGLYGDKNVISQNGYTGIGGDITSNSKRQAGGSGPYGPSGPSGPSGPINHPSTQFESSSSPQVGPSVATQSGLTGFSQTGPSASESGSPSTFSVFFPGTTPSDTGVASSTGVATTQFASSTQQATGIATTQFASGTNTQTTSTSTQPSSTESDPNNNVNGDNDFGYGGVPPRDQNLYMAPHAFGTLPYGNQGYTLLGAGIPVFGDVASTDSFVGDIAYQWGAHAAWYFAIFVLALIPLTLILALAFKTAERVVTTQRVVTQGPVVTSAIPAMGTRQAPVLI
eukprot:TRINITY_DN126_c0_g2_i1.p1 TRINITY_DN126_c0_g2~~TRINITY_DN126_c0_g2_i1.p1  ORF type:complete len:437 (+),score=93.49 TRINITY_DN126_c0_g2_i1:94-1404(+)